MNDENYEVKDKSKKRVVVLSVIAIAVVTILTSLTYAFFNANINPVREEKLTVISGTLALTFSDNTDGINAKLLLGDKVTKEFKIHNTGSLPVTTNMYFKDMINTYMKESLSYILEYKTSETGQWQPITTASKNIPRNEEKTDRYLAKNLTIPAGEEYIYKLTITFEDLDINQDADKRAVFNSRFTIGDFEANVDSESLVPLLLGKTNNEEIIDYNLGNKGEMYTFSHAETEQTGALTDYRYIGVNPNNWIKFNDEDWRIIGVFTVDGEQRIKIMRNESIGKMKWNSDCIYNSTTEQHEGTCNNWANASLKTYLNEDYYNGLNATAKKQIASSTWYLGASSTNNNGETYYKFERSNLTGGVSGSVKNTTANIGLIYPSDYVYTYANGVDEICYGVNDNCYTPRGGAPTSGWMYNGPINKSTHWILSPRSGNAGYAFLVNFSGIVGNLVTVGGSFDVAPAVYLKSDIKTTGGDGSEASPYTLQ